MVKALAKATTIATRYSCVRHQSELEPGYIVYKQIFILRRYYNDDIN